MSEGQAFKDLLQKLENARSLPEQLGTLAAELSVLRDLRPEERYALATRVGLSNAMPLIERLTRNSRFAPLLLRAARKAEAAEPDELQRLLRVLQMKDGPGSAPAPRPEAKSGSGNRQAPPPPPLRQVSDPKPRTTSSGAAQGTPRAEVGKREKFQPRPASSLDATRTARPVEELSAPPAAGPSKTDSRRQEKESPADPITQPVGAPLGPPPDPAVDVAEPDPVTVVESSTVWNQAAWNDQKATYDDPRPDSAGVFFESPSPTTPVRVIEHLKAIRRRAGPTFESDEARRELETLPVGWARRRALCLLIDSGTFDDMADPTKLLEGLEPADELWVVSAMLRRPDLSCSLGTGALELLTSRVARRRLSIWFSRAGR